LIYITPMSTDKYATASSVSTIPSDPDLLCVLAPMSPKSPYIWVFNINDLLDNTYPVGLIVVEVNDLLALRNFNITFKFTGWEDNPRIRLKWISILFNTILFIINLMLTLWCFYKLYSLYRAGEYRLNISTVCISLEVLCCLLRALFHLLTILVNSIVVPYTETLILVIYYFSFPFTLSSGIFLIFFWIDLTSKSLYRGTFLDKAFWPCVIFVITAFILLYASGIVVLIQKNQIYIYITSGVVLFFSLVIAIIYLVGAKRISNYIKQRQNMVKELNRMTKWIVISGVVIILIVVISVSLLALVAVFIPYAILGYTLDILMISRTYLQIEVFSTPKDTTTNTTNDNSIDMGQKKFNKFNAGQTSSTNNVTKDKIN